jgi:hypothetical protein
MSPRTTCRACGSLSLRHVLDLGTQGPSNALLAAVDQPEKTYPLVLVICLNCWLLQTETDVPHADIFTADYPYYSGGSFHWRRHCREYAAAVAQRFGLTSDSYVVEVGGNDGTLLRNFDFCNTLNIEPSANVARAAMTKGVPTVVGRFQEIEVNADGADLIIANNVLAHDPDINGFVAALARGLAPRGTATVEFQWAKLLLASGAFDTIYHEHYSYLSLTALIPLFRAHGLHIYDVEVLGTHGGSLRIYAQHLGVAQDTLETIGTALSLETELRELNTYEVFRMRAFNCAGAFYEFMRHHCPLYGMGAAAKATVFANFCLLTGEDVKMIGDVTPAKWGKFLPGSRIPIGTAKEVFDQKPEYLWIPAWNWKDEIAHNARAMGYTGKFVVAIPELKVFE